MLAPFVIGLIGFGLLWVAYRKIGWVWQAKPLRQDVVDRFEKLPPMIKKART